MTETANRSVMHASCVAVKGRGLLILGPSGAGKSSLALRLMALGADLVADDRTEIYREGVGVVARCPPALRGLIEARGVGILRADCVEQSEIALVADLGQREPDRIPLHRRITLLGYDLDLVLQPQNDHFPEALMHYLRYGRQS
ncbi:HPr kinase/phosphatase C-terminal domain-containing protein [Tabrizicola sp.]|uniref:HPr kinase/phosphorylase n=1 Tax=Tabrizicola sp. TaxID=2005166 RepID=UPI00286AD059|nr:HPr kinase/phosphatase C-terminal domain-containing protein [Tabrizicola sp.]